MRAVLDPELLAVERDAALELHVGHRPLEVDLVLRREADPVEAAAAQRHRRDRGIDERRIGLRRGRCVGHDDAPAGERAERVVAVVVGQREAAAGGVALGMAEQGRVELEQVVRLERDEAGIARDVGRLDRLAGRIDDLIDDLRGAAHVERRAGIRDEGLGRCWR